MKNIISTACRCGMGTVSTLNPLARVSLKKSLMKNYPKIR
jgi:hypothetical protein